MRAIYIPKQSALTSRPNRIDFGSRLQVRRSIGGALGTLTSVSVYSDYLYYCPPGLFHCGRNPYRLARYVFLGPAAGDEPVKIGVFAAINGDEPEGTAALVEFLLCLDLHPERARGCQIFVYPICNPTGFEDGTSLTRSGHDLQRELWNGSRQPEAYYLGRELGVLQFHGVVNLRSVMESNGIYFHISSATLREALVEPALESAGKILPRDKNREGMRIIRTATDGPNRYEWGLSNPAELNPAPFEITLETPRKAPPELQSRAMVAALNRIIDEYRPFLATQQHI
jgi:murein peptide amidase A